MDFNLMKISVQSIKMSDDRTDRIIRNLKLRSQQQEVMSLKSRYRIHKALTAFFAGVFVILLGVGVWKSKVSSDAPFEIENDGTDSEEPNENAGNENTEIVQASEDIIIINPVGDIISGDRADIALLKNDFIKMSREELADYYDTAIFPEVPSDLKEWDEYRYGIYRRDGGTGETYYDNNVINYSNEDFSRSLNIEVSKGRLPVTDIADFYEISEKSKINGVEVGIGLSDAGYYFVEFIYNNTGFRIIGNGLSEEELITVITSLII